MRHLLWVLALAALTPGCRRQEPPFSAKDALKTFQIEPGYRIEEFAAEPDVMSPVAMEFDEMGRIYVVENPGYPINVKGRVGRVKLLLDTDGDGRPDRSTLFADRLVLPTGVMRWKKGILVTDAPDVLYLEDTDGDGWADVRKVVLTGFAFTNPQHTVNGPLYGLDNWIYLAHENATTAVIFKELFGDRGGDIRFAERPGAPRVAERGRNIRFRPDSGEIEALSGTSQFGHAFDDWGRHFTLNNTYHARHAVIAARYLRRNPELPAATVLEEISDHGIPAKVFPISARPRLEMLTNVGQFTSACGLTFWRGGMFVAEPAHNLVHRDTVGSKGATFLASRSRENAEFLASTDSWFRPVNFYAGPDGALYLADYYRLVVEHPEWMSTDTHESPVLYEGSDRGRIYRIVPEAGLAAPKAVRLGEANTEMLVAELANPNPWWRRNAQRLLLDRKPADAGSHLARLLESGGPAVGRVHALWTLEGLGLLENAAIQAALRDPEPGVRESAILLAEARLPALAERLLTLVDDPDVRVRFQLLCTLGFVDTAVARAARDRLLFGVLEDRWFQVAALSASPREAMRLFDRALAHGEDSEARASLLRLAASAIGAGNRTAEIERVLRAASGAGTGSWRAAAVEGLAAGMRGKPPAGRMEGVLLKLYSDSDAKLRRASLRVLEALKLSESPALSAAVRTAASVAVDGQADAEVRADAIRLLSLRDAASREPLFRKLLESWEPEPVQAAAARALGRIRGEEVGRFLLKNWRAMTVGVRMEAADALYQDTSRLPLVVAALQSGEIQPWTLAFRHKRRLIMHEDPALRAQARPLLEAAPSDRAEVLRRYEAALERRGDPVRGRAVFKDVCAKCHQWNGSGPHVGPDLATVRHQPKNLLLEDILMPSRSIAQGYEAYVVETVSGATLDGVLGPQTPEAITLRSEEGREQVIQRKDIRQMYATELSAMPADLEKQVDEQRMADLLEFLKQPN